MADPNRLRNYSGSDTQPGKPVPNNHRARTSLFLGIFSILVAGFLTGIPGIIIGVRAYSAAVRGEATGRGLALGGIILSAIGVIASIIGIIWISIHGLPSRLA